MKSIVLILLLLSTFTFAQKFEVTIEGKQELSIPISELRKLKLDTHYIPLDSVHLTEEINAEVKEFKVQGTCLKTLLFKGNELDLVKLSSMIEKGDRFTIFDIKIEASVNVVSTRISPIILNLVENNLQ